jgi:hypothetical protein
MQMAITHVELELAREPAHPYGNREYTYDLYLPIRTDGRIDGDRAGCCDGHCRFRCRKPGGCKAHGTIRLSGGDRLELDYGGTRGSGKVSLPGRDIPLRPGQLLPIADDNGEAHLFQVLSLRQEQSGPAETEAERWLAAGASGHAPMNGTGNIRGGSALK